MTVSERTVDIERVWGRSGVGPLDGLRVLDLSRVLAGPLCSQMLADHGASVIKVEGPAGDDTRHWGPPFVSPGTSAYYYGLNRSKRNVCLDFGSADDRAVVLALAQQADVVIENFKAGSMEGWGLGYEDVLRPLQPRLVYCRITGYGDDGPSGGLPGYDAVLQAFAGLMSINGYPDKEPLRFGSPVVDITAAHLAFMGIMLALRATDTSGEGERVDIALLDAAVSLLHPHSANWSASGDVPQRTGSVHPVVVPYQVFETSRGPFFISAANDRQFAALVDVLGMPELATDERFATNPDRVRNREALTTLICALIERGDPESLGRELTRRGVPSSPVHDVAQALAHEQVRHRGLFVDEGDYRGVGIPLHLSRSGTRSPQAPAPHGADTNDVREGLGLAQPTELSTPGRA